MKSIIESRTGLKLQDIPKKINKFGGHEKDNTYYCGYWRKTYKVLEIREVSVYGWEVVCQWEDGKINSHSTRLWHGKDFLVID